MKKNILISPSILSADFSKMGDAVRDIEKCGADLIHCDVMDGVFVKNITFGSKMVRDIKKHTKLALDTHLMIVEPERYIDDFISAGSDFLTFHVEACKCIRKTLLNIKNQGVKCGLVVSPDTDIKQVFDDADLCDMILVMSVYPGFAGQSFIPQTLYKIKELKEYLSKNSLSTMIEVDGGINFDNSSDIIAAGADVLVAGNTIFSSKNMAEAIAKLRKI